jgi:hypothetical protein
MDGMEVSWEGDLIKDVQQGRQLLDRHGSKARKTQRSVQEMLAGCASFENEKTLLHYVLEDKLDSLCMLMPKCHPEIAGRGIEYAWGYSKLCFHNKINDMKQKHLDENLRMALTKDVLTLQQVRKVACGACEYKLNYSFLAAHKYEVGEMPKALLDHITKQFKHHCSALDSDYAFI